jgi:hypothetical protein
MAEGLVHTVADHVTVWIADGGSIHIKTRDPHGDPVELAAQEARELVEVLNNLIRELEAS